MPAKLITAPSVEPISLTDAKAHLYVFHNDDDALIGALVVAARADAERRLGRALINQTWELSLDAFPDEIELPYPPLVSVTSIKYLDSNGVDQVLDPSQYLVDADSAPGAVVPAYGASWPPIRAQRNTVRARYVAGYGADGTSVPAPIKQWILLRIGALYENRESSVSGQAIQDAPRGFADALLDSYRVLEF